MKIAALCFIAFIALASCDVFFLEKSKPVVSQPTQDHNQIEDFFGGFFQYFNLSQPSQILDCFGDINAKLFIKKLYDFNELLEDATADNVVQVHIDWIKVLLDDGFLRNTQACVALTQDFTDLLDALNVTKRNPKLFEVASYLYYQAHYEQLLQDFGGVINNLDKRDFNASGYAYGSVIANLVNATKQEGLSHLAYAGFRNGEALHFDIDEPTDSLQCFDRNSSEAFMRFIYELSVAVTNGSFIDAPLNSHTFWENRGQELLKDIPDSAWDCLGKSNFTKLISEKLGVDISSKEFGQLAWTYIKGHRFAYYGYLRTLKHTMEHLNLNHAGGVWGSLLQAIAKK